MGIFKRQADAATLERARDALRKEEAKIAELTALRAQKLIESDDVAPVAQIGRQIEQHAHNARALRDKIPLIEADLQQQADEKLEQRRAIAISAVEADVQQQLALAEKAEAKITELCELFADLTADRNLGSKWPFPRPTHLGHWSPDNEVIAASVLKSLNERTCSSEGKPRVRLFGPRFWPAMNWTHSVRGLAAEIRAHFDWVLSQLREAPLAELAPKSSVDDEIAA